MAIVQNSYMETHAIGLHGQVANTATCDADSKIAEEDIQFGRAVSRGTDDEHVRAGAGVDEYIGVTIKDRTRDPSEDDAYAQGAHAAVGYRGDIFIEVESAVAVGDPVYGDTDDGLLSATPGGLRRVTVDTAGAGYQQSTTSVTIGAPPAGGTQAVATATVGTAGAITAVTVTTAGAGYITPPSVTVVDSNGARPTTAAVTTGVLDTQPIPGASWETSAAANGIARLRLRGNQSTN